MKSKTSLCDERTIQLFLAEQLGEEQQAEFERHLDVCEGCAAALRDATATQDEWADVCDSLQSADFPAASSGGIESSKPSRQRESACLSFLSATDDPHMLGRFAGYEIAGVIGYGGMGIVLKAFDAALHRFVAIKVLAPHLATSGAARKRFAREAQAAAAVTHDNVIAIHGVDQWNDLPYLVMPYVRGESLQRRIDRRGPQGTLEILRVGRQIADGLAAAHAQGLVHRDIKPANILMEEGVDRLQITDFGLARAMDDATLTRSGVIAGTPHYMSPEQARGESIDARSDLFSLGSVMYAMATGHPPFRAETSYGILRRITDHQARPVGELNTELPSWLAVIIAKLHAKTPSDRFQSAAEVAAVLEQCLAHYHQPATVPLPAICAAVVKSEGRATPRTRVVVASAVLLLVAIGSAMIVGKFGFQAQNIQTLQDSDVHLLDLSVTGIAGIELDPATAWETTATEFTNFSDDLNQLERQFENIWKSDPLQETSP